MGILFNSEDNSYFIRFMASTNSWKAGDEEVDIKKFLVDTGAIRTGWGCIQLGLAPIWHWSDKVGVWEKRPGDTEEEMMSFKMGFRVDIFGKGFGIRTWSSTGTGAREGFENMYVAILAGLAENKGKMPVVEYTGSIAKTVGTKGGATRVPQFKIERWVETAEFDITDEVLNAEPESKVVTDTDTDFDDDIPF